MDMGERMTETLRLLHILASAEVTDLGEVLAIRHTPKRDGLPDLWAATPEAVLDYTRRQDHRATVFPAKPPRMWLIFMEDGSHNGAHRSRFYGAFENLGEVIDKHTPEYRYFDLKPVPLLEALRRRLVVDWSAPRRWHRGGMAAGEFRVVEIADPQVIPFVGYDRVLLPHAQLRAILADPHYSRWHSALSAVKGIYLISDKSNGKQYVGKADGARGILGRWDAYAQNGHGWNRELVALPTGQSGEFLFSILRIFGPEATQKQIDEAERHYKEALLTRGGFGYNAN